MATQGSLRLARRPLVNVSGSCTKGVPSTSTTPACSRALFSHQSTPFDTSAPAVKVQRSKLQDHSRSLSLTHAQRFATQFQARAAENEASGKNAADKDLKRTPLYDLHVEHGAKMVPFGGYSMPVQYADQSVKDSHLWTRSNASLFDVSHMVQHRLQGPAAQALLERITPAGLASLPNHHSTLSAFLHPLTGGIVDDTVITRLGPQTFYIVTNAGCRDKDQAYLRDNIEAFKKEHSTPDSDLQWEVLDDYALVALQGPLSAELLEPLLQATQDGPLSNLHFGQSKFCTVQLANGTPSSPILLSRGGYTGEDGFEMSVRAADAAPLTTALLTAASPARLRLAGLAARDSLRLEAGMCLYGADLDDSTTPAEAGLAWIVARDRRATSSFHGAAALLPQLVPRSRGGAGTRRRRVGLLSDGPPARAGAKILAPDGQHAGTVTSGTWSPSLGRNIAMGYVESALQKAGTEVKVDVRGRVYPATVVKMPFVPSKYWKGGATPG